MRGHTSYWEGERAKMEGLTRSPEEKQGTQQRKNSITFKRRGRKKPTEKKGGGGNHLMLRVV